MRSAESRIRLVLLALLLSPLLSLLGCRTARPADTSKFLTAAPAPRQSFPL